MPTEPHGAPVVAGPGAAAGPRRQVLLMTSHPLDARDGADKELSLAVAQGMPGTEFTWFGRMGARATEPMSGGRRLPLASLTGMPGVSERVQAAALALAYERRVDLVHAVVTIGPRFAQYVRLRERVLGPRRRPAVHTVPAVADPGGLRGAPSLGTTVALSATTQQALLDAGYPDVRLVPPGIDLSRWQRSPRPVRTPPVVAFAGHYDADGGLWDTVTALGALRSSGTPVQGVFLMRPRPGEDERREGRDLVRRAREAGLEDVVVHGRTRDMPAMLATVDVLVLPARDLGGKADVPLTVLEAMASGRPTVVTDLPQLASLGDAVTRVAARGHGGPHHGPAAAARRAAAVGGGGRRRPGARRARLLPLPHGPALREPLRGAARGAHGLTAAGRSGARPRVAPARAHGSWQVDRHLSLHRARRRPEVRHVAQAAARRHPDRGGHGHRRRVRRPARRRPDRAADRAARRELPTELPTQLPTQLPDACCPSSVPTALPERPHRRARPARRRDGRADRGPGRPGRRAWPDPSASAEPGLVDDAADAVGGIPWWVWALLVLAGLGLVAAIVALRRAKASELRVGGDVARADRRGPLARRAGRARRPGPLAGPADAGHPLAGRVPALRRPRPAGVGRGVRRAEAAARRGPHGAVGVAAAAAGRRGHRGRSCARAGSSSPACYDAAQTVADARDDLRRTVTQRTR